MDPAQYYSQTSSSQYPNQYQDDGRNHRLQVVPVDNQAIHQYINELYQNPSPVVAPPTNDPAFFAKAQHDMMHVKHKLEYMMLVNQQQAEMARINSQR
jgi:hypothetical protein